MSVNSTAVYVVLYSHKETYRDILFDIHTRDFPDIPYEPLAMSPRTDANKLKILTKYVHEKN